MKDSNICPSCSGKNPLETQRCGHCGRPLVLPAHGAVSLWRLGPVRSGIMECLARQISAALHVPCVIQPAFLDERSSIRTNWRGVSANVFLRQVLSRSSGREVAGLGITEKNIVPSSSYNFLFGYAYLGLPAATASIHPLAGDNPPDDLLLARLTKIALHELGHTFGLLDHSYRAGRDCLMLGDVDVDTIEEVDMGRDEFCEKCRRVIEKNRRVGLGRLTISDQLATQPAQSQSGAEALRDGQKIRLQETCSLPLFVT